MVRKKLSGKKGFTLTELLVAMAIMALLSIVISVGIATTGKVYTEISASSEASILCSTLSTELADELRFAKDVSVDNGTVTFTSHRFGANVSVTSQDGRILIGNNQLLSDKAYSNLYASAELAYESDHFTVSIEVYNDDKDWSDAVFSVATIQN